MKAESAPHGGPAFREQRPRGRISERIIGDADHDTGALALIRRLKYLLGTLDQEHSCC